MSMLAAEHVVPGWREAIEEYYARGWTDGLPVVPATADGVQPFLDEVGLDPDHVVLTEPVRRRTITAGKVAINATFAAKPVAKNSAASLPNIAAASASSATISGSLPRNSRDPPDPTATPRANAAATASRSRGSFARPR